MGNCLPFIRSQRRTRSRSSTNSSRSNQPRSAPMSFSNPAMEGEQTRSSAYVNQLYAANVARQRAAANGHEKEQEEARRVRVKGLLEQIPADLFRSDMKASECAICMVDFEEGEQIRFLPCMHFFHQECVDDWLLTRSFTCPSCMEPVDSTIFSSLTAHTQQTLQDLGCSPAVH